MEAPVEKVDVLAATEEAGGEEASEALALLTQMILIIIVFIVGWQLEKRHVHWISEAAVGLIIGVAAGGIAYVTTHEFNVSSYADWMNFDPDFFFFGHFGFDIAESSHSNFHAVFITVRL